MPVNRRITEIEAELKTIKADISILENNIKVLEKEKLELESKPIFEEIQAALTVEEVLNERLTLYKSYFRGRTDVYAKKSINKHGKKVYYPVVKQKYKVWNAQTKRYDILKQDTESVYEPLTNFVFENHLSKYETDFSVGIYPLIDGDKCYFIAIDFDGDNWRKDTLSVINVSRKNKLKFLPVISQSGNGGHLWFFFDQAISAYVARRMATILLSEAMEENSYLSLKSYDRIFPSQDYLAKDGIGNLIALPLEGSARQTEKSTFLYDDLTIVKDEDIWGRLAQVQKNSEKEVNTFVDSFSKNYEFQYLKGEKDDSSVYLIDNQKNIKIILRGSIWIDSSSLNSSAVNFLRRISSFRNPEFYKKQRMRFSTWDTPRVISTIEQDNQYLVLPRNCLLEITETFKSNNVDLEIIDERTNGNTIDINFNGKLKPRQQEALSIVEKVENGVISAPTGFGKTVLAAAMISKFKRNTLIIVPNIVLLKQWKKELEKFLDGNFSIGQLGDGKNSLSNEIDVAIINSLEQNKHLLQNYGLVFVDECHRAASFRYENVLKNISSQRIYGMTATPIRNNGQEELIFMQCGNIIYEHSGKLDYLEKDFEINVVPVMTNYKFSNKKLKIHQLYKELQNDSRRNNRICEIISKNMLEKRSILVLSNRVDHLHTIGNILKSLDINYIQITGTNTEKERRIAFEELKLKTDNMEPILLLSTGQFIGEGFNLPALDTLILASPLAYEGNLTQYIGRVNRDHENKRNVFIYDIVDFNTPVLSKMYLKRSRTYKSIGYNIMSPDEKHDNKIIFSSSDFRPVFENDFINTNGPILISIQKVTKNIIIYLEDLISQKSGDRPQVSLLVKKSEKIEYKEAIEYAMGGQLIQMFISKDPVTAFTLMGNNGIWFGDISIDEELDKDQSFMRMENAEYYYDFISLFENSYPLSKG